jgi:methylmalonyl-CoA mutase N-terminal domain/subunit
MTQTKADFMMQVANATARAEGKRGPFRPTKRFWADITEADVAAAAEAMHDYEYTSSFADQSQSYQDNLKNLARAALESFASQPS